MSLPQYRVMTNQRSLLYGLGYVLLSVFYAGKQLQPQCKPLHLDMGENKTVAFVSNGLNINAGVNSSNPLCVCVFPCVSKTL